MNEIKNIIVELTIEEKQELLDFLKLIINNEFESYENAVCECYKYHSTKIVKLGTYKEMQRYICKNCSVSFPSKSKSIFVTTKYWEDNQFGLT